MAAEILTLTDANFELEVKARPWVLVDFWAEWCGPCRMIAPVVEELAGEYQGRLAVGKVNVDQSGSTAARFGIRSIPTLLLFKDGVRIEQIVGAHPKATIKSKIDQHLTAA